MASICRCTSYPKRFFSCLGEKTAPEASLHLSVPLEMLQNFVFFYFLPGFRSIPLPQTLLDQQFCIIKPNYLSNNTKNNKKTSNRKKTHETRDPRPCRCAVVPQQDSEFVTRLAALSDVERRELQVLEVPQNNETGHGKQRQQRRTPKRWRIVRGHDKPIHGSCAIDFPGGIALFVLFYGCQVVKIR